MMNKIIIDIFWAVIFWTMIALMSGCSTMHILKDCKQVQDMDEVYVCKNLKPWE